MQGKADAAAIEIVPRLGNAHIEELAKLRGLVRLMRTALESIPAAMIGIYSLDGYCMLLAGGKPDTVDAREGLHYSEFVPPERMERFEHLFGSAIAGNTNVSDYPVGNIILEATTKPLIDEYGVIVGMAFYVQDVTGMRALQTQGARDSMTGLAKRSVLTAMVNALMHSSRPFTILFIDLDNFKSVNDTMGHEAGDSLLKRVSRDLQNTIRQGDLAVRAGGDEFIVILADLRDGDVPERVAAKLAATCKPFGAGASIGVSRYPAEGTSFDMLLALADQRMYTAKKTGGGVRR